VGKDAKGQEGRMKVVCFGLGVGLGREKGGGVEERGDGGE